MWWGFIIVITLGLAVGTLCEIMRQRGLRPLLNRPCAGTDWRKRFPSTPKNDIREFLRLFVDSFALPKKRYLVFRPDDLIMDIYRATSPPDSSLGDVMEIETFAQELERRYSLNLEEVWSDNITLGEIFEKAISA